MFPLFLQQATVYIRKCTRSKIVAENISYTVPKNAQLSIKFSHKLLVVDKPRNIFVRYAYGEWNGIYIRNSQTSKKNLIALYQTYTLCGSFFYPTTGQTVRFQTNYEAVILSSQNNHYKWYLFVKILYVVCGGCAPFYTDKKNIRAYAIYGKCI